MCKAVIFISDKRQWRTQNFFSLSISSTLKHSASPFMELREGKSTLECIFPWSLQKKRTSFRLSISFRLLLRLDCRGKLLCSSIQIIASLKVEQLFKIKCKVIYKKVLQLNVKEAFWGWNYIRCLCFVWMAQVFSCVNGTSFLKVRKRLKFSLLNVLVKSVTARTQRILHEHNEIFQNNRLLRIRIIADMVNTN